MALTLGFAAAAAIIVAAAVAAGRAHESAVAGDLRAALLRVAPRAAARGDGIESLPAPVARYLRHALPEGAPDIARATFWQAGTLRAGMSGRWLRFNAMQTVVPGAGFLWEAKVAMAPGAHIRVLDACIDGAAAGRVSLFSCLRLAADSGSPELNSGALHRYLAEAVWFPTALLPGRGVRWQAVNDEVARAHLTVGDATVSLDFRFNAAGEVASVYTAGRMGKFSGGYRRVPWEGRFGNYRLHDGVRIPHYGEVGWHHDGVLQLVWRGSLVDARFERAVATGLPVNIPTAA